MADISDIIRRARAHAVARECSLSTVSRKLFGNGMRLEQIESGQTSIRVDILERASERLAVLEQSA